MEGVIHKNITRTSAPAPCFANTNRHQFRVKGNIIIIKLIIIVF